MVAVKLFSCSDKKILEENVNAFCKNKNIRDIQYQSLFLPTKYANGVLICGEINDRVMIVYEDKTAEDLEEKQTLEDENISDKIPSKWCSNCKYHDIDGKLDPCCSCINMDRWESII